MSAAEQAADPEIALRIPLSGVNFILASLDKNPLGHSVVQVSGLMAVITKQAQEAVAPPAQMEIPE